MKRSLLIYKFFIFILLKKLATIALILLCNTAFAQLDSLKISVHTLPIDTFATLAIKLDSMEASARGRIDSVTQYYNQTTSEIHELTIRYQQKVDSSGNLKLPTVKFTKKLDSLNNARIETVKKVEGKIQSIKQKTIDKINSIPLPPELQSKVSAITGSLDKLNLSSLTSGIKSPISLNEINTSLEQLLPSADLKGIPNLPSTEGLPDVGKSLGGVDGLPLGITEQAGALQTGAGEITQGASQISNIDQLAESQLSKLDAMGKVKDQLGSAPINPLTSEDEAKKQLLNQATEVATDHFAGKEEVLKSAMEKISKYKQKYSSITSLSDISTRPPNPMKGRPLIERIVPGLQFQLFQKQGNFLTDINLYAGYLVNGRLTIGIGWNQRVAYNLDRDKFNSAARVFGPRAFGEFKLGRGFSPRAEAELMNMLIPSFISNAKADDQNREWVVSGLVGIKKEYKFYKNIKGTTTIMINVLHPRNKSPYPDWLNARFGFEFPLKKRQVKNVKQ